MSYMSSTGLGHCVACGYILITESTMVNEITLGHRGMARIGSTVFADLVCSRATAWCHSGFAGRNLCEADPTVNVIFYTALNQA